MYYQFLRAPTAVPKSRLFFYFLNQTNLTHKRSHNKKRKKKFNKLQIQNPSPCNYERLILQPKKQGKHLVKSGFLIREKELT